MFICFCLICIALEALYDKLNGYGIRAVQYAFRWSLCFMLREFPFKDSIILWDALISEPQQRGFSGFIQYVAASYMLQFTGVIMAMNPESILLFLNNLPVKWDEIGMHGLIIEAFRLRRLHKNYLEKREVYIRKAYLQRTKASASQTQFSLTSPQIPVQNILTASATAAHKNSGNTSTKDQSILHKTIKGSDTMGPAGVGAGGSSSGSSSSSSGINSNNSGPRPTMIMDSEDSSGLLASPKFVSADYFHSSVNAVRAALPVPTYSNFDESMLERAPEKRRTIDILKWAMN